MNGSALKVIPWFVLFGCGAPADAVAMDASPSAAAPIQPGAPAASTVVAPAKIPHASEFTFAQREARNPILALAEQDMVAFPVPNMPAPFHAPFVWSADPEKFPYRYAQNRQTLVAAAPVSASLETYLARRAASRPEQWQELVDWCLQQKLPLCAEYELRCKMAGFKHFYDPGYKVVKDRWLKLVEHKRSDYIFPLPVQGEWFVVADTSGHHRMKAGAAFAFDLTILKNGKMHAGTGRKLEDYYSWRQPVLAQADGIVVQADDHFDDLPIEHGASLAEFDQANYVVVDYGGGIRAMYGHLHKGSLKVQVGDTVQAGQTLGEIGNSGASGAPHLHFTLLDNGNLSLRGRFAYERLAGNTWVAFDGDDLKESVQIRNLPNAFPPPVTQSSATGTASGRTAVIESPVAPAVPVDAAAKDSALPAQSNR